MVGGKEIPGSRGEIGAYIARVIPGGVAEQTGKVLEGKRRVRKGDCINLSFYLPQWASCIFYLYHNYYLEEFI